MLLELIASDPLMGSLINFINKKYCFTDFNHHLHFPLCARQMVFALLFPKFTISMFNYAYITVKVNKLILLLTHIINSNMQLVCSIK